MYEFTGKVKGVGELQTFASGFTKRDLVVEEERAGNWPNVVAFAFKKERVALLDGIVSGTRVKVGVRGGRPRVDRPEDGEGALFLRPDGAAPRTVGRGGAGAGAGRTRRSAG